MDKGVLQGKASEFADACRSNASSLIRIATLQFGAHFSVTTTCLKLDFDKPLSI
jgi:hypothetical protein